MKDFTFNKIYIIQSLSLDPTLSSYRIGDDLKTKIDGKIALSSLSSVQCELVEVHSISEWQEFVQTLESACKAGCKPILHFICHGNTSGLCFDGITGGIKWSGLMETLSRVNVLTSNNLFVSLCACYGFWSLLHILDEKYRIPFCGAVACPYPIHVYTASKCFPEFYKALLEKKNIIAAKTALVDEINKIARPTSTPADEMYVEFTDDLFMKAVLGDYNTRRKDMSSRVTNAKNALKDAGKDYNDESLIKRFLEVESKKLFDLYKGMRDYKFMFDLYPQDKARYNMPDDFRMWCGK